MNVIKILGESNQYGFDWLPNMYRLVLLFECGVVYCLKNNELGEMINKRDVNHVFSLNSNIFKDVYAKLIRQDRSILTKYLDEVVITLNSQK